MKDISVGERIQNRRKELEMSVDALAEKIGKNRATVYRYEAGEIENVSIVTLKPLADALLTTPSYLMGWEESSCTQTTLPRQTGEHLFLSPTQQQILSNCRQLNETGQQKVLDFSEDLLSSNNYSAIGREPGARIAAYGATETEEDIQSTIEETTT